MIREVESITAATVVWGRATAVEWQRVNWESAIYVSVTSRVNALALVSTSASAAIQAAALLFGTRRQACSGEEKKQRRQGGAMHALHRSPFSQIRGYVRNILSRELPPRSNFSPASDVTLYTRFTYRVLQGRCNILLRIYSYPASYNNYFELWYNSVCWL